MSRSHHGLKRSAQRAFIDRAILLVAVVQPLAALPQVFRIYTTQDASGIAMLTWAIFIVFDAFWFWYGVAEKQKAVIISATLFATMDVLVLIGASMYGGRW